METLLPGITLERAPTSRLTVAVLSVAGRAGAGFGDGGVRAGARLQCIEHEVDDSSRL